MRACVVAMALALVACQPQPVASLPAECQQYLDYLQRCERYMTQNNATMAQVFQAYREQAQQHWQQERDLAKVVQQCRQSQQQIQTLFKPQGCE